MLTMLFGFLNDFIVNVVYYLMSRHGFESVPVFHFRLCLGSDFYLVV